MQARHLTYLCLLALLVAAACKRQQMQPTVVDTSGRGAPPGGRPVGFAPVNALPPSPEPGFRVVRSAADWGTGQPPIDFAQGMVLIASAGMAPTGGHSMTVQSVTEAQGEVHVMIVQNAPGPNCSVPQAAEWVGAVVGMEKIDLPVRVHVSQTQSQPCFEPPIAELECGIEGSDRRGTTVHVPVGGILVCDASGSRTDGGRGGPPARGSWAITTAPEGAAQQTVPDAPRATVQLETPGRYVVTLTIADEQGTEATAEATILVGPPTQQTEVKLEWVPVSEGATVDLPLTLHVFRGRRDCSPASSSPPAWCQAESPASPSAARTVRLPADSAVGRFEVAVDYPSGNRPSEAVAQVTLLIDGVEIAQWRDAETREAGYRWEPGAIILPNGMLETR